MWRSPACGYSRFCPRPWKRFLPSSSSLGGRNVGSDEFAALGFGFGCVEDDATTDVDDALRQRHTGLFGADQQRRVHVWRHDGRVSVTCRRLKCKKRILSVFRLHRIEADINAVVQIGSRIGLNTMMTSWRANERLENCFCSFARWGPYVNHRISYWSTRNIT